MEIYMEARAKINLALDVTRKRTDGYHNLRMIMQSISLYDVITLKKANKGIGLECSDANMPCNDQNTAFKAAISVMERYGIKDGIKISIDKNIPSAAGLAGGSADAAAVIRGMNVLFGLGMTTSEMMETGSLTGSDVPFCIIGGTALAEGKGDIITPLPSLNKTFIVIVKPPFDISTVWAYRNLNLDKISRRPDIDKIIDAVKNNSIEGISENMINVLESVVAAEYSEIDILKLRLLELGAAGAMMSGSGSCVFGVFKDETAAADAAMKLSWEGQKCFLSYTTDRESI